MSISFCGILNWGAMNVRQKNVVDVTRSDASTKLCMRFRIQVPIDETQESFIFENHFQTCGYASTDGFNIIIATACRTSRHLSEAILITDAHNTEFQEIYIGHISRDNQFIRRGRPMFLFSCEYFSVRTALFTFQHVTVFTEARCACNVYPACIHRQSFVL